MLRYALRRTRAPARARCRVGTEITADDVWVGEVTGPCQYSLLGFLSLRWPSSCLPSPYRGAGRGWCRKYRRSSAHTCGSKPWPPRRRAGEHYGHAALEKKNPLRSKVFAGS
ncbi:hypothetical protein BS78_04G290800 [Paspalum vaginatum]|nr:hypothetical protein BS78_04G290800 [Paspalum vaginatum]